MIDRRAFIGIAAVPFLPRLDEPDIRVDNLDLEQGERILTISPNGETLAGTCQENLLCFFEPESLDEISNSELPGTMSSADWLSVRWSPDSSKIVFTMTERSGEPRTTIYMADAKTANLQALLPSDHGTPVPIDGSAFVQDSTPEWIDDQTIVFVRHTWGEDEDTAVLMHMRLDDDAPSVWNGLADLHISMINGPIRMLSDGRLAYVANPLDSSYLAADSDKGYRLFTAAAGEAPKQVDTGDLNHLTIIDADETHVLLFDVEMFQTWRLSWDDPTAREDVSLLFQDDINRAPNSLAAMGAEPNTLVVTMNDKNRSVVVYRENRTREIAYLRGPETTGLECMWVDGRVLIAGSDASWLIEMDDL